jgi:hypothetical protein
MHDEIGQGLEQVHRAVIGQVGFVANPILERRSSRCLAMHSCDKQVKLLGERWLPIAGVLRLLLAHHVDHLDPTEDHSR